jgi:hypothetical protein
VMFGGAHHYPLNLLAQLLDVWRKQEIVPPLPGVIMAVSRHHGGQHRLCVVENCRPFIEDGELGLDRHHEAQLSRPQICPIHASPPPTTLVGSCTVSLCRA